MARSRSSGKKKSLSVNFKGVEGRVTIAEGEYTVKVAEVTLEEGQSAEYLKWKFEIQGGKFDGKPLFTNTSLSPQALWNLRGLLEAMGVETPDDEMDLDLADYVDRELLVTVEHEMYEGKKQARVVDYASLDDAAEEKEDKKSSRRGGNDEDDDEKPARRSRKSNDDDEGEEKQSRRSRRGRDESEEEDEKSARRSRRGRDEDEDEKPSKRGKKKPSAISTDDVMDMSQDELEDLVTENDLEIDLSKIKTLTKMRNQVVDALDEANLLAA